MLSHKKIPIIGRVKFCLELIYSQSIKNKTVVDVGSSFGWLEKEILKLKPKKIIGIEPSKEALSIARKNVKNVEFIEASALNIPVKSQSTDLVIFFDVIEHVPVNTEEKALLEINRILKQNGKLLLTTPNNFWLNNLMDPAWYFGHRHYTDEKLDKLLRATGFKKIVANKRGGMGTLIFMFWFYLSKLILRIPHPRNQFMENLDDLSYSGVNGYVTHYIVAQKIRSFKS